MTTLEIILFYSFLFYFLFYWLIYLLCLPHLFAQTSVSPGTVHSYRQKTLFNQRPGNGVCCRTELLSISLSAPQDSLRNETAPLWQAKVVVGGMSHEMQELVVAVQALLGSFLMPVYPQVAAIQMPQESKVLLFSGALGEGTQGT